MIKVADIRNTVAYKQLRAWNNRVNDGNPWSMGALVKKYLVNINDQKPVHWKPDDHVDIDISFIWDMTPEGHHFWSRIQNVEIEEAVIDRPAPAPRAAGLAFAGEAVRPEAKKPKAKEEPKKVLGWWRE